MNDIGVKYTDEVMDALFERFGLSESIPIISVGTSMSGTAAIIYSRYSKRTPVACAANCPPCDLLNIYSVIKEHRRIFYYAFAHYNCSYIEALESISPYIR